MANYSFFLSDGVTEITVTDSTVNNNYTLPLLGQNVTGYGDDVAIGTMRHLENFSASVAPESNTNINGGGSSVLKGQLWFDSGNNQLNVNIGTTASPNWQSLASAAAGTTTSSMLRWGGTEWVEETQMRVTSGGTLQLFDTGLSNNMAFQATGTAFNIDATTINTVVWSDIGSYMQIADGAELRVSGDPGNAQAIEFAPGDAASVGLIRTVGTSRFRIGGSITRFDVEGALGLEERGAAASAVASHGQVWVSSADNGLYYTNKLGSDVRIDVTAGGTVTATNGVNNRIAVFSSPTNINGESVFTWDSTTLDVGSTSNTITLGGVNSGHSNYIEIGKGFDTDSGIRWNRSGGIDSRVYVDNSENMYFTIDETNTLGTNTFRWQENGSTIATLGGGATNSFVLYNAGGTDNVSFSHDGTDFNIAATATASIIVQDANLTLAEADTTKTAKLTFLDVSEDDTTAIEFYPDPANGFSGAYGGIQWFDDVGGVEMSLFPASGVGVMTSVGGFLLSDNGTGASDFLCTISGEMSFEGDDGGTHTIRFSTNDGTGTATSKMKVVDRGGSLRNVGYNETPGLFLGTGNTDLATTNVSKQFYRSPIAGNSTITCANDNNIPNGSTWIINNWQINTDTGTCTILEDTGVTLYWMDGSGSSTASTGTRTLAKQGVCTIRKHSLLQYHIWGSGLS